MSSAESLGSELRSRNFPSSLASAARLGVDAQQSAGRGLEVAVQSGLGGELATQLGALGGGEPVGAGDRLRQGGDQPLADLPVAVGGLGVEADHEPVPAADVIGQPNLFDLQVVRDLPVAAGAGECRGGLRGSGAQSLAEDVVPAGAGQVAAVLGGGEAAVGDP